MRFYPLLLICGVIFVAAGSLDARIGESKLALEARMLHERRAASLPDKMLKERLAATRVPYISFLSYLPSDTVEHAIYFKKSRNAQVARSELDQKRLPDGWELHVVYFNGVSVFEAYRRVGSGITDAELNGLLVLNQTDSHWEEIPDRERRESEDVFKPSFILNNKSLKAARSSNAILIFYRPELEMIIRHKHQEKLHGVKEDQQRDSVDSLQGF